MFRFTIRDLLWLMVVVALLLVIVLGYVDRIRLESDMSLFRTDYIANRNRTDAAYQQEILKLGGKRVTGIHYKVKVDPNNVPQFISELEFAADEPTP